MTRVVHSPLGEHAPTWKHFLAVYLWLGWVSMYTISLLALAMVLYGGANPVYLGSLLAPWAVLSVWPGLHDDDPEWGHKIGAWIMRAAREYFHLTVVLEDEEALAAASAPCAKGLGRPVVIALEPHDILPFSIFASSAYLGLVPGSERRAGLMTSAVFWLPGMRQIYRWTSGASIGKTSFSNELRRGATVCLIPGGVQEVVAIKPEERKRGVVVVYLRRRKGFVKLALAHQAQLVPAFAFGLHNTYDFHIPRGALWTKIGRAVGFLPLVFWGWPYGIPYGIPRPSPLTVVYGSPLPLPSLSDADTGDMNQLVEIYHAQYIAALVALVERNKVQCGMPEIELRII